MNNFFPLLVLLGSIFCQYPLIFAANLRIDMASKITKSLLAGAFSIVLSFLTVSAFANDTLQNAAADEHHVEKKEGEEKFNVTETILDHIKDEHGWHLWGHTTLPLPVILYTQNGIDVFSSAHLINEHHEPVVFASKNNYKLFEGKIKIVDAAGNIDENATKGLYDISITKNVASMLLSVTLLLLVFLSVASAYKKTGVTSAPKGLQSFIEPLILFVRDDVAKPNIGAKYAKFMPFLLTIFFFILINNLLGLIPFFPGAANVSGNIAFTFTLAFFTLILVNINGNKDYWKHIFWMPGVPVPMKIFLLPIELIGVFTKPISLMIRLFANITAGHILVLSLICLIFIFKSVVTSVVAVPFAVFIGAIELLVAFLQAFIFTLLASLYIGSAIEEHHHHEAHH
jgi:F-type H+-transporting ATPase subunit a